MRRLSALSILIIALMLVLPLAVAADDPPAPTTRHQYRVDSLPIAGLAEVIKFVLEFPQGAQTPPHTHPGLTLVTVLEGEITFDTQGAKKVYKVGDSFTEPPNVVGTAVNTAPGRTRVMASLIVPKGAPPSTPQPGAAAPAIAPTTLYLFRADAFFPGDPYEVAQTVLDFAPGAQTPAHTHPGQTFVTVLAGEITFTTQGATKVYKVGESFIELPEAVGVARNAGAVPATVLATYLLPKGAPLSTPVATPGLPVTGGGGMAGQPAYWRIVLVTLPLLFALGGGWFGRRHARRA